MRGTSFAALAVLSLAVAGYAMGVYGWLPLGAAVHPDMRPGFESHSRVWIYVHVFAAALTLLLGPLQFVARVRAARPVLHRWSGRLYLGVGVLLGGVSGLVVAFNAFGGPIARAGFVCLAAAWLFTGFRAYRAIRSRDVAAHRRWMVRNYALAFAAVMLRLWLPAMVVSGVSMVVAYQVVAWLCWMPNAVVAEWLLGRSMHRVAASRDGEARSTPGGR